MNRKDKIMLIKVIGLISLMAIGVLYAAYDYKMDLNKTASQFVPDGIVKSKAEQQLFIESNSKPLWQTTTGYAIQPVLTGLTAREKESLEIERRYNLAKYYFIQSDKYINKTIENIGLYHSTNDYKYAEIAKKYAKLAHIYDDSLQVIAKQK